MKSRTTNRTFPDNADWAERIRLRGTRVQKILAKANSDMNGKSDESKNIQNDVMNCVTKKHPVML